MDELKKYKLERKNKYYYCIGKGVIFLTGVYATSGISSMILNIPTDTIIDMFGLESWIVTLSTLGISFIKTLPETKKITKIKRTKIIKKIK